MNYSETLDFLFSRLPMFTRVGASAYKEDLSNIQALCHQLGNPQQGLHYIHIAGTNGKGSTSHMLASILQKAGYKTGLYTSPHLKDFRERIRINGKMIPKTKVIQFIQNNKALIPQIEPSFFELTLALAFQYFKAEKVDVVVLEVGLGGRLDSTNIIHPDLSIITNISLDHTNLLGDTIPQIASEKAGIIKAKVPIIIGEKQHQADQVFLEKAAQLKAPILFANQNYQAQLIRSTPLYLLFDILKDNQILYPKLKLDLKGKYQAKNILNVVAAIDKLRALNYKISSEHVYQALSKVSKLTGLKGRWQTLNKQPKVICDTGHNEAGIQEVLINLQTEKFEKLHMVIGMVKDKDITKILNLLPKQANYYFCAPALERALDAEELKQQAHPFQLYGKAYGSVALAYAEALKSANYDDLIFIGGSTFVVAELI